jgi:hypothetical protein
LVRYFDDPNETVVGNVDFVSRRFLLSKKGFAKVSEHFFEIVYYDETSVSLKVDQIIYVIMIRLKK